MTEPRVLRDITDGELGVDNLCGSVGVCTAATDECQDEDPAPKQGWLVGETMLLVAGCWLLVAAESVTGGGSCGCPSKLVDVGGEGRRQEESPTVGERGGSDVGGALGTCPKGFGSGA